MRRVIVGLYRFLPVQLLLLHFRKYQMLLVFWVVLFATITGHFASHFGASSLFLSPEYRGEINFISMLLLGGAMAVYVMSWHITTFIIHSSRIPFMGAARQAFLKYCINNSLLPLLFLVVYSVICVRYQWINEHTPVARIVRLQLGFYLGFLMGILISFAYFFRVDRDLLKVVLSKITDPSRIREIIPYDSLDYDFDMVRANTYISETFRVEYIDKLDAYHPRLLAAVLRRHHRNAVAATIFAFLFLLLMGVFMDKPMLRLPAGSGFLILFAVLTGIIGAVKYFLKSWEFIGWVLFVLLVSWMVGHGIFDLRSIAYGLDYKTGVRNEPVYNYQNLAKTFNAERYQRDAALETQRLQRWKDGLSYADTSKPPLVVISISGGGSRAAYWTFRCLQYLDSASRGRLFRNTVLMTGASGGMIGATYWRALHQMHLQGKINNPYLPQYQENVGKDLLNAIIFSLASVDLISPFNKISIAGYSYTKDRGYAMEQELIRNTQGVLDQKLSDFQIEEAAGQIPLLIVNGTIVNDGRKLMMSSQPLGYLTQPAYATGDTLHPPIDAIDFAAFFQKQNPYNLRVTTALRMNATFPFVLPVVRLPSQPKMNIMDAGLRDNFGMEVVSRYVYVLRDWINSNTGRIVFLQIRDTREHEVFPPTEQNTLGTMMADPLFVIQNKWEPFQSYHNSYIRDYLPASLGDRISFINLEYIPEKADRTASLNFHLTHREKIDILQSLYQPVNKAATDSVLRILAY